MMNYMKSEGYRLARDRGIMLLLLTLCLLSFLFHAGLAWMGKADPGFRYDTTSFSFSNLVANPMLFYYMGAVIGTIVCNGSRQNGNLKNTVAFGISRSRIFLGGCIMASLTAIVMLVIVLSVYILSAWMFLNHAGPVGLMDLISEIPAVFLLSIASLICGIICMEVFDKSSTGVIVYLLIWFITPKILLYIGMRFDMVYDIAMWLPENFFSTQVMKVNMSTCNTLWESGEGLMKCIVSGAAGVIIFTAAGLHLIRKREF